MITALILLLFLIFALYGCFSLIANIIRNESILRGRDNLNSNKTPKEFCKDKDCVAKGDD